MTRTADGLHEALESGRGVERPFRCHVHDDANASASVNVEKGLWYCYACGASGRVEGGKTFTVAMKTMLAVLDGTTQPRTYPSSWLDWFDQPNPSPYWVKRYGFITARRFRCGTHPETGLPTYPIMDSENRVLGVVQRTGAVPKYLYPPDVPISKCLFNYARRSVDVVVVVEGAADVMALHSVGGLFQNRHMVVGAYGAGLHQPQVEMINGLRPKTVLLGFDSDPAGQRANSRDYGLQADVGVIEWPRKDPGECTSKEARRVFNIALNNTRKEIA